MAGFGAGKWKHDEQLWWTGARPGDKLVLAVPVAKSGKYEVSVNLTKARDYGIVKLSLDDKKAGEPIDLYNTAVVPSGPISLGTHELSEGQHTLTVEIVGANPAAQQVVPVRHRSDRLEAGPVAPRRWSIDTLGATAGLSSSAARVPLAMPVLFRAGATGYASAFPRGPCSPVSTGNASA